MSELALELIEKEKRERTGGLDLGRCGLSNDKRWVAEVWKALEELEDLEELILGGEFRDLGRQKWIPSVNTGNDNIITSLPSSLEALKSLKKLHLRNVPVKDIDILEKLSSLEELDLSYTSITSIQCLADLRHLKLLNLSKTPISHFPILQSDQLQSLNLWGTKVKVFASVSKLKRLQYLNLAVNSINDLKFLEGLKELQTLNLESTLVEDIRPLAGLIKIKDLKLSRTKVSDVSVLAGLTTLEILNLSITHVTNIQALGSLTELKNLNLSRTQIEDISPLSNMGHIQKLMLWRTSITDLKALSNLKSLEVLSINDTFITDLSPLSNLEKLRVLDICKTRVTNLFPLERLIRKYGLEPKDDNHGEGILLHNCNLINPPIGVVRHGRDAILRYWEELKRGVVIPIQEIKLFLLGNTTAGKSSLSTYLRTRTFVPNKISTHGADLREVWEPKEKNLRVNIWDFGGQEVYHASYRLFLAGVGVAVVVADPLRDKDGPEAVRICYHQEEALREEVQEHFRHPYWLRTIQRRAPHAKLLFVWSKLDEEKWKGRRLPSLSDDVKGQYQIESGRDEFWLSVADTYKGTPARARRNWEGFEEHLIETLSQRLSEQSIPQYWLEMRNKLESQMKEQFVISIGDLKEACRPFEDQPDLMLLLIYLRDTTGSVLYFGDLNNIQDEDWVYLNPSHVNAMIYGILSKQVLNRGGYFDTDEAKEAVKATWVQLYGQVLEGEGLVGVVKQILGIMANPQFELVFEVAGGSGTYVASQYLGIEKPEAVKDIGSDLIQRAADFVIRFSEYVPRHVIPGFIASKGKLSKKSAYWKHGILYMEAMEEENPTSVLVEYFPEQREIGVWLGDSQRREALKHLVFQDLRKRIEDDGCFEVVVEGKTVGFEKLVEEWNDKESVEEFLVGGWRRFGFCFGVSDRLYERKVPDGEVGMILSKLNVMEDKNEWRHLESMTAHGKTQGLVEEVYQHLLRKVNHVLDRQTQTQIQVDQMTSSIIRHLKGNSKEAEEFATEVQDALQELEGFLGEKGKELVAEIALIEGKNPMFNLLDKIHLKAPLVGLLVAVAVGIVDASTAGVTGILMNTVELDVTVKELLGRLKGSYEKLMRRKG